MLSYDESQPLTVKVEQHISLSFIKRVHCFIAAGNTPQAIDETICFIRNYTDEQDPLYKVLIISSEFKYVEESYRNGLFDYEIYARHKRKLLYQLLYLIDEVTGISLFEE